MNYMQLNADVLYYLQNNEDLQIYGLAGVTYGAAKVTILGLEGTGTDFSYEAGAGVKMGSIFIEGKYDAIQKQIVDVVDIYF